MDSTTIVEILLGLLTLTVGFVTFIAASRTQKQRSLADQTAVDAAAYERAKEIYESALQIMRDDLTTTRSELLSARNEIMSLRGEIATLREELRK